jgi:uncharacterized protein
MGSFLLSLESRLFAGSVCIVALIFSVFVGFVDLQPKVTPDFFFGSSDPDLAQSEKIRSLFPSEDFLVISIASDNIYSPNYLSQLSGMVADIQGMDGVSRLVSIANGPGSVDAALASPFWRPLLIDEDGKATLIIAFIKNPVSEKLVAEVEAVSRLFDKPKSFQIRLSGMPYIVDQIRKNLVSDFKIFSSSVLAIFSVVLLGIFRSPMIALGAAVTGISAVFLTFILLHFTGQPVGILTANLAIIVFVLVQSQVIFLTSNWRQFDGASGIRAVRLATMRTFKASFWCTVTTLLGFATLLFVAAEPLRQLGEGGVIGSLCALVCCYLIYPAYLLFAMRKPVIAKREASDRRPLLSGRLFRASVALFLFSIAIVCLAGLQRLNTDPSLFSYFEEGTDLHEGLTYVDSNGGSSPMSLVVRLKSNESLDSEDSYEAMWRLHNALLAHNEVRTVISLPALMAEANDHPLAFILPWQQIISLLSLDINQRIADSFLTEDRKNTLFTLRMREDGRQQDRNITIAELQEIVDKAEFEISLMGGVYFLQGRLSDLVASSLSTGIFGLLGLFVAIAFIVSQKFSMTIAMGITAALIPSTILGGWGWLKVPVDIISAPAVNVCFGIAVDALIHLAIAIRRNMSTWSQKEAWSIALQEQTTPVLTSTAIIAIGFIVFAFSGFPPTARFGGAIVIGAIFAGCATLTLFPVLSQLLMRFGNSK